MENNNSESKKNLIITEVFLDFSIYMVFGALKYTLLPRYLASTVSPVVCFRAELMALRAFESLETSHSPRANPVLLLENKHFPMR